MILTVMIGAVSSSAATCSSQSYFDHDTSRKGQPASLRTYVGLDLSYNPASTYAYSKTLHGVTVTVGIDHGSGLTAEQRQSFANVIFNAWNLYWVIFNGFPYSTYTVLIMPGSGDSGAQGGGYIVYYPFEHYNTNCRIDTHVHEVFHAWNSGGGGGVNPFNNTREKWFIEGVTQYYQYKTQGLFSFSGPVTLAQATSSFQTIMRDEALYHYVDDFQGTADDIALINMGTQFEGTDKSNYYYYKGALMAYLLDQRLNANGSSLDALMRYLYGQFNYGLQFYTSEDIRTACEALSGVSFADLFNSYVFGNTTMPFTRSSTFTFYKNTLDGRFVSDLPIIVEPEPEANTVPTTMLLLE